VGTSVQEESFVRDTRRAMGLTTATSDYFLKSWLLPLLSFPDVLEFAVGGNSSVSLKYSFLDPLMHFAKEEARILGGYVVTGDRPSQLAWRPIDVPPSGYFGIDYVNEEVVSLRFANSANVWYIRYYIYGDVVVLDEKELSEVLPGVVLSFRTASGVWQEGAFVRLFVEPNSFPYEKVFYDVEGRIDASVALLLNDLGVLDAFLSSTDVYRKAALLAAALIRKTLLLPVQLPEGGLVDSPPIAEEFPIPGGGIYPNSLMLNGNLIFLNGIQIILS
jgi:hypothetical protein